MKMTSLPGLLWLVLFAALANPATARDVAGVTVPPTASVAGATLQLNGAGIRKKFFIKVYVGALYLPEKADSTEKVLAQTGPKRVSMHILYSEISAKKLTHGWHEGFEGNMSEAAFEAMKPRLDAFNKLFVTVKEGDIILLDYDPASGTSVTINGTNRGSVEGADFNRALLNVWLGEHPADSGLKRAMLAGG